MWLCTGDWADVQLTMTTLFELGAARTPGRAKAATAREKADNNILICLRLERIFAVKNTVK